MAFTKISAAVIADGAITADLLDGEVPTVGPSISSISIANSTYHVLDDTAVNVGGGYIVITGENFDSGANVTIGSVEATSVTYVSGTTLRVQVPAQSAASYTVYVNNSDGASAIKVSGLTYSALPLWVTDATLTTVNTDEAFNVSFNATGAVSYANTTAIPDGTSLLSNGYFYGTITGLESNTNYTFTIRATDAQNQDSDKEFTLPVSAVVQGQFLVTTASSLPSNMACCDTSKNCLITCTDYCWTVPNGVASIGVVAIGAGAGAFHCISTGRVAAGAGGSLGWINCLPVTEGETIRVCVSCPGTGSSTLADVFPVGNFTGISRYSDGVWFDILKVLNTGCISSIAPNYPANVQTCPFNGLVGFDACAVWGTEGGYCCDTGNCGTTFGGGYSRYSYYCSTGILCPGAGSGAGGYLGAGGVGDYICFGQPTNPNPYSSIGSYVECSGGGASGGCITVGQMGGGGTGVWGCHAFTTARCDGYGAAPGSCGGYGNGNNGNYFGGGGGSAAGSSVCGNGGHGAVRIFWGPDRDLPGPVADV